MSSVDVPVPVQQFIQEYIQSAEQLDILLQLYFSPDREWDPNAVSQAVFTTPSSAEAKLEGLVEAGFLSKGTGAIPKYRYAPASPQLHERLSLLGETYKENRGGVLEFVFAKNLNPVKSFADAFRLGKKD